MDDHMRSRNTLLAAAAAGLLGTAGAPARAQSATELSRVQSLVQQQSRALRQQATILQALQVRLRQLEADQKRSTTRAQEQAHAPAAATPQQGYPVNQAQSVNQEPGVSGTQARTAQVVPVPPASGTPAFPVLSGGDRVRVTISGQVNRAALFHGDGSGKVDSYFTDYGTSSTRLRLLGAAELDSQWTVNSAVEFDLRSNASSSVGRSSSNNNGGGTPTLGSFRVRRAEVGLASKDYGSLLFGRGSMAADGITTLDLSGTAIALYATGSDSWGSLAFANHGSPPRRNGDPTMSQVFDDMSGMRDDRIRYDAPTWRGFTASTSIGQGSAWDVALRYAGKLNGVQLIGGVAYMNLRSTEPREDPVDGGNPYLGRWSQKVSGSLSVLLPSGLNATVAAAWGEHHDDCCSTASIATVDGANWFGKLGYQAHLFDFGTTNFSVDAGQTFNSYQNGDIATRVGFAVNQAVSKKGIDIYAAYERLMLHRTGEFYLDSDVGIIGTRVQF
jgi:hypothetical protein